MASISIPINPTISRTDEIASASDYINERLKSERKTIDSGYYTDGIRLFVVGGGFGNSNGIVLHRNEAYQLLDAYKNANYYTYIQWSPYQHLMRAIVISNIMLNLDGRYFERYY